METGTFRLQENSFIAGERKLVIKQRKRKGLKPELYLIKLQPFEYVSSLFPAGEELYTFDYGNKLYYLRRLENQVEVSELNEES